MMNDWKQCSGKITLALGSDHGGFELKKIIKAHLETRGFTVLDCGPEKLNPQDDYTDYGVKVATAVRDGKAQAAVLLCRSGIGMSVTANRFPGIRAALVTTEQVARASREHNNSNIIVVAADVNTTEEILHFIDIWSATPFSQDARHERRLQKIDTQCYDEIAALRSVDPAMAAIIDREKARESRGLELIASENFASCAVRACNGSVLTNKYAEGYPNKRYYSGCVHVDEVEQLAIDRACELFGAEAANVQPHSGSQANMAAYMAILEPGDTVLGMSLDHGGHLTHGHKVNFSGKTYQFIGYGVDPVTEQLNYDTIAELARTHKPKLILAGASAYPRIIDFPRLRQIADEVGAFLMVDMAHIAGLVAAGCHPSPMPYCDIVTTTTHKTLRGPRGGLILSNAELMAKINSKVFPGIQGGPLMQTIAAKAVCFHEALQPSFKEYQRQIVKNAAALANALAERGFRIVSGGTDNHLMLVDLRPKGVTGKDTATALDKADITVNMNMIPFDPAKPTVTSGIRVGTPAVTTRGMKEPEMLLIADFITRLCENMGNDAVTAQVRAEVNALAARFPMPQPIFA